MTKLEIEDMIEQCENDKQRAILERLKLLNVDALQFMRQNRGSWKYRYRALQRTTIWREAKQLITEYFRIENGLLCDVCKKPLGKSFTLHHDDKFYNSTNLFTPSLYCCLIHNSCHQKKDKGDIK